jgi:hypothetical protein
MRSWRTTLGGIASILSAVAHVITALVNGTPVDWALVSIGFGAGTSLLKARDNKVTSEEAGAK